MYDIACLAIISRFIFKLLSYLVKSSPHFVECFILMISKGARAGQIQNTLYILWGDNWMLLIGFSSLLCTPFMERVMCKPAFNLFLYFSRPLRNHYLLELKIKVKYQSRYSILPFANCL